MSSVDEDGNEIDSPFARSDGFKRSSSSKPPRRIEASLDAAATAEGEGEGGGEGAGDAALEPTDVDDDEQCEPCDDDAVENGTGGGASSSSAARGLDSDDENEEDLCSICFTGPQDAVLLECGHGGICYDCAKRCLRKKGRECPMCRAPVDQVVQINVTPASPSPTGVVRVKQTDLPEDLTIA